MPVEAARVSKTIKVPPKTIWKALTSPSALKQFFFGSDIETDWRVGSPITFKGVFKGRPYEDKGVIQTFTPEKQLVFTHFSPLTGLEDKPENYHIVSFDLEPAERGTTVVLTQQNQNPEEKVTPESRKEAEANWTMLLDGLAKTVGG